MNVFTCQLGFQVLKLDNLLIDDSLSSLQHVKKGCTLLIAHVMLLYLRLSSLQIPGPCLQEGFLTETCNKVAVTLTLRDNALLLHYHTESQN